VDAGDKTGVPSVDLRVLLDDHATQQAHADELHQLASRLADALRLATCPWQPFCSRQQRACPCTPNSTAPAPAGVDRPWPPGTTTNTVTAFAVFAARTTVVADSAHPPRAG
jgi:hypothetical protein